MADLESRARARGKLLRNQQNPEEDPAKKAANEISTIIRTQRKECRTLQQHPIFKELQSAVGLKKISKSLVESEGDNGGVVKPAFDDVQSEGVARMFEKIRQTAIDNSKPLQGIWASFGKPYVCMGAPEEVCPRAHAAPVCPTAAAR